MRLQLLATAGKGLSKSLVSALMVTIRGGKAEEGKILIITEGDIDVVGETTGEGEYHVPRNIRCTYSKYCPQIRDLNSCSPQSPSMPININVDVLVLGRHSRRPHGGNM